MVIALLLGCSGIARADWTGVALQIGDLEADWEFDSGRRAAKSSSLHIQIEERTPAGLTVGGGIGYLSLRVDGASAIDRAKFEAQNLEVYLRQEFPLGEYLSFESLLRYGYYSGTENVESDRAEIDWTEVSVEFGASARYRNLRITPFASYTYVDGDISGENGTEVFELEGPLSYGLRFDIFTERTAFIGIRLQAGSRSGGYLSFVRRY